MTDFTDDDYTYMKAAQEEAKQALAIDEVPIGAVVVEHETGNIVGRGHNMTITMSDPTAHAEIMAIREACRHYRAQRIPQCDLYVTLEPCAMCAGAISFARIRCIVFGAPDQKAGGVLHGGRFFEQPTCHHRCEIVHGLMAEENGRMLKDFFAEKRQMKKAK